MYRRGRICPRQATELVRDDEALWPANRPCSRCGWSAEVIDGIVHHAPTLADTDAGYDRTAFAFLAAREAGHFWFEPRNRLLLGLAQRYFPRAARYLEIGCGTGFVLAAFARTLPYSCFTGAELHPSGLAVAPDLLFLLFTRRAWAAILRSALSKIAVMPTLAGTAFAETARSIRATSMLQRNLLIALSAGGCVLGLLLVARFGPFLLRFASFGPEAYEFMVHHQTSIGAAWPYLARDVGIIACCALTFRFGPWSIACALTAGFLLAFTFPFLMRVNFVAAAVMLSLLAAERPDRLAQARWHAWTGFGLLIPAMVMTDPGGLPTGIVWCLLGGGVWLLTLQAARRDGSASLSPASRLASGPGAVVLMGLLLLAVARGNLVPDSGWYRASRELTPAVRDIWDAVRHRTPPDALIFTDQTGREPTLLGGWNTYAFHGARQVFIANYYQSFTLRDPAARDRRLAANEEVLAGTRAPNELQLSRP